MSTVKIGSSEQPLENADESWINNQINGRRRDGETVCVLVRLKEDPVDLILSTPNCGGGGGGSRLPNAQEERIIELWNKHGLNQREFQGGNLVAFLKQLRRILGK